MLHDHHSMIDLNPLVLRHETTQPPPNATLEEQVNCIWYLITDQIKYLPGNAAKSELNYKAGFYDLPHGLQTHVFAPGGVDLKAIWRVGGNMPGEKPEPAEMGVAKPASGLYIREDVEVRCNVFLHNFVKRNLNKSHGVMVQALINRPDESAHNTPRPSFFAESPTNSVRSTGPVSPVSQTSTSRRVLPAGAASITISPPTSRQSSTNTLPHQPSPYAEPCSCGEGGHEVMCPNFRYGAPPPRKTSPAPEFVRVPSTEPVMDQRWPPRADMSPRGSTDSYSPEGAHPNQTCMCLNGDHALSCPQYVPRAAQRSRGVIQQQATDKNLGRVVWKLPPGSNPEPTVAYRSPQLFGEQAELPGSTVSTERDESWDDEVSEVDNAELAYWSTNGTIGDMKMAPGDGGWL
jgi:hypothetical protein